MSNNFLKKTDKIFHDYISLDKAELNVAYVIVSCNLPDRLQERFAELGFVVGAEVKVIKAAPLGDPLEVNVMGYSLCARASELKHFNVTKVSHE